MITHINSHNQIHKLLIRSPFSVCGFVCGFGSLIDKKTWLKCSKACSKLPLAVMQHKRWVCIFFLRSLNVIKVEVFDLLVLLCSGRNCLPVASLITMSPVKLIMHLNYYVSYALEEHFFKKKQRDTRSAFVTPSSSVTFQPLLLSLFTSLSPAQVGLTCVSQLCMSYL